METLNQNIGMASRPFIGSSTVGNEVIWTNTPGTIRNIHTAFDGDFMDIKFSVKGLNSNNFSVKVSGNLLVVIVERKKEVMKTGSWGKSYYDSCYSQKFNYSVFERSDIFLPGEQLKKLEDVKFDEGDLFVRIQYLREEIAV